MNINIEHERLFFGIIHVLTKDDLNNRLTEQEIIANVTRKIPREKAMDLFSNFSKPNIKYIEEDATNRYRISDVGMVYYEQLDAEWKMEKLQLRLGDSAIATNKNAIISGWMAAGFAFLALVMTVAQYFKKDPNSDSIYIIEKYLQEQSVKSKNTQTKPYLIRPVAPNDSTKCVNK